MEIATRIKHAICLLLFIIGIFFIMVGIETFHSDNIEGIGLFIIGLFMTATIYGIYAQGYWSLRLAAYSSFVIGLLGIYDGVSSMLGFSTDYPLSTGIGFIVTGIGILGLGYISNQKAKSNKFFSERAKDEEKPTEFKQLQKGLESKYQDFLDSASKESAPSAIYPQKTATPQDVGKISPSLVEQMKQTRAELKVGDVLGGQYEIRDVFGKGGMGTVYKAYDREVWKKLVALKSFKENASWNEETREGLKREALTWVNLGIHPNIVQAKTVQEFHGKIYIVMEYVDGGDLGEWMINRRLDIKQSLDFGIQFCNGMEYAFETMKMVHRDIKPGNILITKDGSLKITDFGIATTAQHQESGGLTLPYGSPEQFLECMGEQVNVDTRTDIYSFGVVLYEMLTGRLPLIFSGRQPLDENEEFRGWAYQHLTINPRDPSYINNRIPPQLGSLVMRCLAKDANHRYGNFRTVKEELMKLYKIIAGQVYALPEHGKELRAWHWGNKGLALFNLKRYEEAIRCYDRALEINPELPVWANKGLALGGLKRYEEAIRCYDRGLELDSRDELAWNNKGLALHDLKRYEEAIRCYDSALEINPQHKDAWNNKGADLMNLKRYEEAIQCCDKALKIDPQDEHAWNNKGLALDDLKRYEEAIRCYDRALEINPQFELTWTNKAVTCWKSGDWKKVIHCLDKTLELNPDNSKVRSFRNKAIQKLRGI